MMSALGAINGLILTGSRIYASLGADHAIFAQPRPCGISVAAHPAAALVAQGAIAVLLVLSVGTAAGRLVD